MTRNISILVILFSLFSCAGPRRDSAGIINSQRISQADFIRSLQGHTANFQLEKKRMPNADEKVALFNETWKNIATHVILKEQFKRHHIEVTPQEVIDSLMTNIPGYYRNSASLQVNGTFDPELYYQSVRYDSPVNMANVRRNYYEYYVPVQKLKASLIEDDLRDKRKINTIAEISTSKADFDLVIFDPSQMEPIVSESEIEAYYQRNLERFAMDPYYSLEYISIPVNANQNDFLFTKAVTDSIYEQIVAGKSLETVQMERSEQLPGIKLLEPGFVRVDNIDEEALAVLEPLPDNSHSRPIAIGGGYHIYQKLQRTKSMMSYRVLQIPPIISQNSINNQYENALSTIGLARTIGTDEAAAELDLELHKHRNLSVTDLWYSDKLVVDRVNAQLMDFKRGDFLNPVYSPITGSWLVIKLTENTVNRVYPLAEVREQIIPEITQNRQKTMAEQNARNWLRDNPQLRVVPGRDLYLSYDNAGIDSQYQGNSLEMVYLNAMRRYINKQAPVVQSLGNVQVIMLPRAYYPQKNQKADPRLLKKLYTRQLPPDWFDSWMQEQHKKARIQIFVKP